MAKLYNSHQTPFSHSIDGSQQQEPISSQSNLLDYAKSPVSNARRRSSGAAVLATDVAKRIQLGALAVGSAVDAAHHKVKASTALLKRNSVDFRIISGGHTINKVQEEEPEPSLADNGHNIDHGKQQKSKFRRSSIMSLSSKYPNYIVIARFLTWIISIVLLFGVLCVIFGPSEGLPGGNVFSLIALYICAIVCGWIAAALNLPPLLGMLLAGVALANIPYVNIVGQNMPVEWGSALRTLALCLLLLRAGLGLDAAALRKLKYNVGLLGVVPVLTEVVAHAVLARFMLPNFTWGWSFLLGFVLAAVSPAIIVPGMLALQEQGLGCDKGIPTLAIAAASFDNIVAISGVGITLGYVFATRSSLAWKIGQGPLEVVLGIGYGVALGGIMWYVPSRHQHNLALFRFGMLLGLGIWAIFGARRADVSGAGALGCLTLAFIAGIGWRRRAGADVQQVSALFAQLWLVVFQPLLFVLIGAAVSFGTIDWYAVALGMPLLGVALVFRAIATVCALTGSGLTWREKGFMCIAWMSKASVQAAIGPLAYDTALRLKSSSKSELDAGLTVLTLAVLSIVTTAPLGAVGLKWGAKQLLKPATDGNNNRQSSV